MTTIKGLNPNWIDFSGAIPQAKTGHITRQVRDLPYGPAALQKLDIYLPEQGNGPFPVIVNVHGGGFSHCDKHDFHLYPTFFALQQGFAVAAVNYRLSPAVRYPEHYFDLLRALLWLEQNGREQGLDPDNLFLWGTSAGGNLVLQAACQQGMPLPPDLRPANALGVRAVAAMCPAIDVRHLGGSANPLMRLAWGLIALEMNRTTFGSLRISPDAARLSNPTTYIGNGVLPIYLQQGTNDPAIPFAQVEAFAQRLQGILLPEDLVFHPLQGAPHAGASEHFFLEENINPILRFYEKHMRSSGEPQ